MAMLDKKRAFCAKCIEFSQESVRFVQDVQEMVNYWQDNGFASGGANPIVQADLDGTALSHLTPALMAAFITAIATMSLSAGQRTTMRQVASQPQV